MRGLSQAKWAVLTMGILLLTSATAMAQRPQGNPTHVLKIYYVNYGFYPIVQAYMRTWDENRDPLPNVNYANLGIQVKGKNYDPKKVEPGFQYGIQTLEQRGEGVRTVLVLDCSKSMAGEPFADAVEALRRFIEAKKPNDQIAIIAIRDTVDGYELVSNFESDATPLYQRLRDVQCDGEKTRLYDSVAAAMELCATAGSASMSATGADFAVLSTIVVFSDGKDEGSAVSREELMNRIGQLPIPFPIYSLAYAKQDREQFRNLEALSKASFGRYWVHEQSKELTATVRTIQTINRSDYVVTFRSYVPVDGEKHSFKIGIEYPSGSKRFQYGDGQFEAIDSPALAVPETAEQWQRLNSEYPLISPPGNPYIEQSPIPNPPPPPPVDPNGTGSTVSPVLDHNDNPPPSAPKSWLEKLQESLGPNGSLLVAGGGLFLVVVAVVLWVKRSGGGGGPSNYTGGGGHRPTTHPLGGSRRGNDDDTLPSARQ